MVSFPEKRPIKSTHEFSFAHSDFEVISTYSREI
jgi:hypothetical protein